MNSFVIETRGLTKRYKTNEALSACDLQVRRGEIFGLLGPNGAGKTTLLRLLMGFLRPTSGTATIDGLDCYRDSLAVHRLVAYLPGDARLFRNMRGDELLKFFSQVRPGGDYQRALALADRLKLELSRRVPALSTGMRQKLALAACLSADAPLLILDEPTSNLDPTIRNEVIALVKEAKAAGRTVLFSSHVLSEVEQACDRVCLLRAGRLVHTQTMSELRRQHRIQARLTGAMTAAPPELQDGLEIDTRSPGEVTIHTAGELSPLLGWLARLPIAEVHIAPVGLQAIYDRYHAEQAVL
jgi:ABC-2 type transport system ATP-binding protein